MTTKIINGTQVQIVKDYQELSSVAADHVLRRAAINPSLSLLVPTGTTPEGVYGLLAKAKTQLEQATFYNMDEYCVMNAAGSYTFLSPDDRRSYHYYMRQHLFDALPAISYFPGIENIEQPGSYDTFIESREGLDFCLNAIGEDGHTFGFNLPGSPFSSVTRLMAINDDTKQVNKKLTGFDTPLYAVTVGLKTGMSAKEVMVLVSGKRKADILRKVLRGDMTETIPATILRTHPNCTWIVDEAATSKL